ncbi:ROK family transcriptional regulator [Paenibacillus sp. GCM10027626]|uniref:ROK family transcriptional regulator n=1 Tax=Paenibacillus sp. GCM10027626 TaxID=3273411 RepID=UPI003625D4E4
MKHLRGNVHLMKEINRSTILGLLHREVTLSRAEIAKTTNLSPATISSLVEELIAEGFIEETGEKASTGAGRRAIALQINRNKGFVIAISLSNKQVSCMLCNFYREPIARLDLPAVKGNDQVFDVIVHSLHQLIEKSGLTDFSRIKGIGIALPGIVEESSGTIAYSLFLELENFHLKERLSERFNVPIHVVNDVNAAAFAEYYLKTRFDVKNVLYISIRDGIGAGLILNGQIYSGFRGMAGEVTTMRDPMLSTPGCLAKIRNRALRRGHMPLPETIADALELYEQGVPWVVQALKRSLFLIGKGIADLINFISPDQVVLDGWYLQSPKCMQIIRAHIRTFTVPPAYEDELIINALIGEDNVVIGTATLMIHKLYQEKVSLL